MARIIVQTAAAVLIAIVALCSILNWEVAMADVGLATSFKSSVVHDHDQPAGLSLGRKLLQFDFGDCGCGLFDNKCSCDCHCDTSFQNCKCAAVIDCEPLCADSVTSNPSETLKNGKGKP